jgi:hypothetical protein
VTPVVQEAVSGCERGRGARAGMAGAVEVTSVGSDRKPPIGRIVTGTIRRTLLLMAAPATSSPVSTAHFIPQVKLAPSSRNLSVAAIGAAG